MKLTSEEISIIPGTSQRNEKGNGRKRPDRKVMRSPIKSNTNILKVYTASLREGVAIAFVSTQHNVKESGFIHPIQMKSGRTMNLKRKLMLT